MGNETKRRLALAAIFLVVATAGSRVLGLVREVIMVSYLGLGDAMGAFTVANKVPNLVRTLLADTALSAAFIPVFSGLLEKERRRVRLKVSTQNYPGAPAYGITQILEAGGWKWEFEAKPLVSFLSIRPSRTYIDDKGDTIKGDTERLVGLPGFAFFGYHNTENPSISGIHLTATGNVLEALSTENSIAVSLGVSISLYKDRFMFGVGWDVYDHRPKARRRGTADYITTFKYWGLF